MQSLFYCIILFLFVNTYNVYKIYTYFLYLVYKIYTNIHKQIYLDNETLNRGIFDKKYLLKLFDLNLNKNSNLNFDLL